MRSLTTIEEGGRHTLEMCLQNKSNNTIRKSVQWKLKLIKMIFWHWSLGNWSSWIYNCFHSSQWHENCNVSFWSCHWILNKSLNFHKKKQKPFFHYKNSYFFLKRLPQRNKWKSFCFSTNIGNIVCVNTKFIRILFNNTQKKRKKIEKTEICF